MERKQIIKAFVQLGELFDQLSKNAEWPGFEIGVTKAEYDKLVELINRQFVFNGWFTKENVQKSLGAWGQLLKEEELEQWMKGYEFRPSPKTIAVIMAGNIPLVGFHDFLSVLITGNKALCKMSSEDQTLLPAFVECLVQWLPDLKDRIEFTPGRMKDFHAVIATGSNNSMQHFEEYFGQYPHVFRKSRTSVAIFNGKEEKAEIEKLGEDIFAYYGLGCRNVTHLIFPQGFEISRFFEGIFPFSEVIYNKKYGNNYDYNKAVYLMNKMELLDNNFVLLRETEELFSPIAIIHYHFYTNKEEVQTFLANNEESIQAIVGEGYIPFGQAQAPKLWEYADNVNTIEWLSGL